MAEGTRRRRTPAQEKVVEQAPVAEVHDPVDTLQAAHVPEAPVVDPLDAELSELLTAQSAMTHHPAGTLPASQMFEIPTILAERSNASLPGRDGSNPLKLTGPSRDNPSPIAVVSADGSVLPFSGEDRDRLSLMGYDVTYLYTKDDAKKVIAHNQKMLRDGNVDRVMHGIPMQAPQLPQDNSGEQLHEALTVAFNPSMLNR